MAVKFDESLKNRIRQATDIVDLVSEHLALQRKGKDWVGICPFHQDHRPSMYVSQTKQLFKCFACGAGGDVYKFVQMRENLSFPEAIERLAERAGIKLEQKPSSQRKFDAAGQQVRQMEPKRLARLNEWVKDHWKGNYNNEQNGISARNYVRQRGITEESVEAWEIGFALDSWDDVIRSAGQKRIPEKMLIDGGIAVARESGGAYDKFRNRLMFPIVDVTGRTIGFGGRTLGDDPAKYMNSPATVLFDKSYSLYGLNKARQQIAQTDTAVIVEGYTDVIMCHQFGISNVVAALGTSLTSGHVRILRRYAKKLVLIFDNDIAGQSAANRALEICLSENIDVKVTFAPDGKDPCDFLLSDGAEAFQEIIDSARDVMEFKWQKLQQDFQGSDNTTDRKAALDEYIRSVVNAMRGGRVDDISKSLILRKLAGILGITPAKAETIVGKYLARAGRNAGYKTENSTVVSVDLGSSYFDKAQYEIIEVLLNGPMLYERVAPVIRADQFTVPVLQKIAEPLFELLARDKPFELLELTGMIADEDASNVITSMTFEASKKGDPKQRLKGALEAVKKYMRINHQSRIKAALRQNEDENLRKITELLRAAKS